VSAGYDGAGEELKRQETPLGQLAAMSQDVVPGDGCTESKRLTVVFGTERKACCDLGDAG
jgi:hypothetical protein